MYDLVHCPVCEVSGSRSDFHDLEGGPLAAVRCPTCGLGIECELVLNSNDYSRGMYDKTRASGAGGDRWARFHHDSAVSAARYEQLSRILPAPTADTLSRGWVDVGCGNGAMLSFLRRRGWQVTGVEPDNDMCRELSSRLGLPAIPYDMWMGMAATSQHTQQRVSVVSFFDSLEHMLDPIGTLKTAAMSVSGGAIVLELPNLDSASDFRKWKHRKNSETFTEHIWHFSAKTLEEIHKKHLPGFDSLETSSPVPGRLQAVFRNTRPKGGTSLKDFDIDFLEESRRLAEDSREEQKMREKLQEDLDSLVKPVTLTTMS